MDVLPCPRKAGKGSSFLRENSFPNGDLERDRFFSGSIIETDIYQHEMQDHAASASNKATNLS